MLRFALLLALFSLAGWALRRVVGGVIEGLSGGSTSSRVPGPSTPRGVQMARDPVCGTYVVPERAIPLVAGGQQHFFCSPKCRDAFVGHRA